MVIMMMMMMMMMTLMVIVMMSVMVVNINKMMMMMIPLKVYYQTILQLNATYHWPLPGWLGQSTSSYPLKTML